MNEETKRRHLVELTSLLWQAHDVVKKIPGEGIVQFLAISIETDARAATRLLEEEVSTRGDQHV